MVEAITFEERAKIAVAVLTHGERLTRKAGSFLGQCAVDPAPLTPAQAEWFQTLAERAGISLEAK
jgi:hypothetical protein